MTTSPNRQPAGTPSGGQFASGSTPEGSVSLRSESAYDDAAFYEQRVDAAQKQIHDLTVQIDADSAQQLGHFLRALHPDVTHARLERDEHCWRFGAALDADGNELDIDRDSDEWYACEDGIDTAVGQFSDHIATAPAISLNHGDGEPRYGDGTVVAVRPAQQ